jgi:hypothetical protein
MTDDGWTNERLAADPEGYLRWQEEQRTRAERERKETQEQSDFERFAKMFVARGGDPSKSREMYERYRNDMAVEAANEYDQATSKQMRSARARAV